MIPQKQNSSLANISDPYSKETITRLKSGEIKRQRRVAEINAKIHDHIEAIRLLNGQKNDLALVSWLPAEIMASIFSYLTQLQSKHRKWYWITVTHVCRNWRQIAMENPELWSCIYSLRHRDAVEIFLKRSKAASLTVHVDIRVGISNYDLVLEQWPRIRSLELTGIRNVLRQDLHNSIPTSSKLVNLDLKCYRFNRYLDVSKIVQSALQLKTLTLNGCYLSWPSCTLENLSELVLESINTDSFKPNIVDVLNILMRSPKLKVLKLDDVGPLDASTESLPLVKLSNLEVLRMTYIDARVCFRLLRLLEHWERACWHILCSDYPLTETTAVYPKFTPLNAICERLVLKIAFWYVDIGSSIFDRSISAFVTSADLIWEFAPLQPFMDDTARLLDTLSAMISSCAWKTCLELDFRLEPNTLLTISTEQWIKLLQAFDGLETFYCSFKQRYAGPNPQFEKAVINALMHDMSGKVLCPKLSKIELRWQNLIRAKDISTKILKCLKYRYDNGSPVDTLVIHMESGINQDDVDEFKRYVKNVEWNKFAFSERRNINATSTTDSDTEIDSDGSDSESSEISIFEGEGDL